MKNAAVASLVALYAAPCNPGGGSPPPPVPTPYASVNQGLAVCGGPSSHPITTNSIAIDAVSDTLTAKVTYNGGCKAHEMMLCWGGWSTIAKPTQLLGFFVEHWDNEDLCTDRVTETLEFDISKLRDDYSFEGGGFGEDEYVYLVFTDESKYLYDFRLE